MKNKKGFTLTEILVVIALLGALLLLVMPNIINIFSGSIKSTMKIQENELKESGLLYLEDFCKNKINNNTCPSSIKRNDDNTYSGYVSLETLINNDYIDEINLKENTCNGCVIFKNSKAEAFITCKDNSYSTETNTDFQNICNLN